MLNSIGESGHPCLTPLPFFPAPSIHHLFLFLLSDPCTGFLLVSFPSSPPLFCATRSLTSSNPPCQRPFQSPQNTHRFLDYAEGLFLSVFSELQLRLSFLYFS